MKLFPLLGLLAVVYGLFCIVIALKKPAKIWNIGKIQGFVKALGEKGTVAFFNVWGLAAVCLGVWLFTK